MISFFESSLRSLSVHRVGNKTMDEFYSLSEGGIKLEESQSLLLLKYFLGSFDKVNKVYNLYHPIDIKLNLVYNIITTSVGEESFHDASKLLAKHLYEVTNHPKIKSGEFYVAFFENIQFQGELHNAIGIFKSENKDVYLKVKPNQNGFDLEFEQNAININKLDKGCLILNKNISEGCTIVCIDSNGKDSSYWMDDFLNLKILNDKYNQTDNMLNVCKQFIDSHLETEFEVSSSDKAELLNKSIKYFKEKESFDIDEFSNEVLQHQPGIDLFKRYKSIYDEDFDTNIPTSFEISDAAVKKNNKLFKSVIKLDKNFQIYINGNKDLIERGFDTEKSMNYYKVYFKEEAI